MSEILATRVTLTELATKGTLNGSQPNGILVGVRIGVSVLISDSGRHKMALITLIERGQVPVGTTTTRRNIDGRITDADIDQFALTSNPADYDGFMVNTYNDGRIGISGESIHLEIPIPGSNARRNTLSLLTQLVEPLEDVSITSQTPVAIFDATNAN